MPMPRSLAPVVVAASSLRFSTAAAALPDRQFAGFSFDEAVLPWERDEEDGIKLRRFKAFTLAESDNQEKNLAVKTANESGLSMQNTEDMSEEKIEFNQKLDEPVDLGIRNLTFGCALWLRWERFVKTLVEQWKESASLGGQSTNVHPGAIIYRDWNSRCHLVIQLLVHGLEVERKKHVQFYSSTPQLDFRVLTPDIFTFRNI